MSKMDEAVKLAANCLNIASAGIFVTATFTNWLNYRSSLQTALLEQIASQSIPVPPQPQINLEQIYMQPMLLAGLIVGAVLHISAQVVLFSSRS